MTLLPDKETLGRPTEAQVYQWARWGKRRFLIAQMRKRGEPVPVRWHSSLMPITLAESPDGTGLTIRDSAP